MAEEVNNKRLEAALKKIQNAKKDSQSSEEDYDQEEGED